MLGDTIPPMSGDVKRLGLKTHVGARMQPAGEVQLVLDLLPLGGDSGRLRGAIKGFGDWFARPVVSKNGPC